MTPEDAIELSKRASAVSADTHFGSSIDVFRTQPRGARKT
jgi:hypothetical protein